MVKAAIAKSIIQLAA